MTIPAFAVAFAGAAALAPDALPPAAPGDDAARAPGDRGVNDGGMQAFAAMLTVAMTPAPLAPRAAPPAIPLDAPPETLPEGEAAADGDAVATSASALATVADAGASGSSRGATNGRIDVATTGATAVARNAATNVARNAAGGAAAVTLPARTVTPVTLEASLGSGNAMPGRNLGTNHENLDTSRTHARLYDVEADARAASAPTDDATSLLAAAHARHGALVREAADAAADAAAAPRPAATPATPAAPTAATAALRADDAPASPDVPDAAPPSNDITEPHAGAAPAAGMNAALLGALLAVAPTGVATTKATATTAAPAAPAPAAAPDATSTGPVDGGRRTARAARPSAARATRAAGSPDNDLSSLDPEFRSRLERVISRMSSEFGHTVDVVETYRGQGRQEELYAQGRSAPGPVVTWTRNSLHTLGRAADLRVDGGSEENAGYRDLRRVAESEGLHTLGAKDPGHVELPRGAGERSPWSPAPRDAVVAALPSGAVMTRIVASGAGEPDAAAAPTVFARRGHAEPGADAAPTATAEVAAPAPVARVASVAAVAAVARVAEPGAAPAAAVRRHVPNAEERRRAASAEGAERADRSDAERAPAAAGGTASAPRGAAPSAGDPGSVLAAVRADAAARVGRIMDMQDRSAPTTVSQMLLSLDNGTGGTDHVRVDVRGRAVSAALSVAGVQRANELAGRTGELREALAKQGLEPATLTVGAHAPDRVGDPVAAQQAGQQNAQQQQQQHAQQQAAARPERAPADSPAATPHQPTDDRGRDGRGEHDARDGSRRDTRRGDGDTRHRPRPGQTEQDAK